MVIPRRALALLVGAGMVAAAPPAAGADSVIPTLPVRPLECSEGFEFDAVYACDRGRWGASRRIRLALGTDVSTTTERGANPAIGGAEPLLPGEHVVLDWPEPSARALLALRVLAPSGIYSRVLALRWRPEHVEITVLADGALSVTSAARSGVLPTPPPPGPVDWSPRSARDAAERILDAVDHFTHSTTAMNTICAALDPSVAPRFDAYPVDPSVQCLVPYFWFGDENVPVIRLSRHSGLTLRVRGGRAVFRTRLTHLFLRGDNIDRPRVSVTARALLARDASGVWRLGTLGPVMPLVAARDRRTYTDRRLAAEFRHDRASGGLWAARNARRRAADDAASVSSASAPPCTTPSTEDPAGDVIVQESEQVSRRPDDHAGVDLTAVGQSKTCLALHTRGPLPPTFTVNIGGVFGISVSAGRVLVFKGDRWDEDRSPVQGITAYLTTDELVVKSPARLAVPDGIELATDVGGIDYGDIAGGS